MIADRDSPAGAAATPVTRDPAPGEEARASSGDAAVKGRSTRQRQAVLSALDEASSFCTAQELHEILRHRGDKVGLATVYRSLQLMADADELDVIRTDGGEASYRRCSPKHHHHLVCRTCGRTVEVSGPTVEQWASRVASEHDFTDVSHTIELFGLCRACSAEAPPR